MLLKSIKGVVSGVTVFDNMFANNKVIEIVQMEGQFNHADQVAVDWNTVRVILKSRRRTVVDDGSEGGAAFITKSLGLVDTSLHSA